MPSIFRSIARLSILFVSLPVLLTAPARTLDAQAEITRVVFIEEPRDLIMSSVTDTGPDGVSRLADIFRAQGAMVEWIRLRDTIPQDVDVIVLVRPRRVLSTEDIARIWMQVGAGASLLVAIDPNGYLGGRTETERSGLNMLTTFDQSISLLDGLLLEPWFTNQTLTNLRATLSIALPDPVRHPVTDPLHLYEMPIILWGARPVRAEPFGVDSLGWSLAVTEPDFAETSVSIFPNANTAGEPFEMNIGVDKQGRLSVAALGENTQSGARVALLGDAEMVQNGFGLRVNGAGDPVYVGNTVITQRIAAWLMRRETYPELPDGILWLALDGESDDWGSAAGTANDPEGDVSLASFDITSIRGIRTGSYLYLMIQNAQNAHPNSRVTIDFDSNRDGQPESVITLDDEGIFVQTGTAAPVPIFDAAIAIGSVIEVRVPLRFVSPVTSISRVCLSYSRELAVPQGPDCVDGQIPIPLSVDADPASLRVPFGTPMATVTTDGVNRANVRAAPNASATLVGNLDLFEIISIVGRNEASNWLYMQTAELEGWVSGEAVTFIGDLEQIPVRAG